MVFPAGNRLGIRKLDSGERCVFQGNPTRSALVAASYGSACCYVQVHFDGRYALPE